VVLGCQLIQLRQNILRLLPIYLGCLSPLPVRDRPSGYLPTVNPTPPPNSPPAQHASRLSLQLYRQVERFRYRITNGKRKLVKKHLDSMREW